MAARIIVENLKYGTTEEALRSLFEEQGEVVSVSFPVDHLTGQPRAVAFVEMASEAEARDAVRHCHRRLLGGRRLRVKPAEEWETAETAETAEISSTLPYPAPPVTDTGPAQRPQRPERKPGR